MGTRQNEDRRWRIGRQQLCLCNQIEKATLKNAASSSFIMVSVNANVTFSQIAAQIAQCGTAKKKERQRQTFKNLSTT